jgi:hypothetical protein
MRIIEMLLLQGKSGLQIFLDTIPGFAVPGAKNTASK